MSGFLLLLALFLGGPAFVLASMAGNGKGTRARFTKRFIIALAGIVAPLALFLLSAFLTPDWKGAAKYGWIDCFWEGKLALTPIVFWAAWGLYDLQIRESVTPIRKFAAQGLVAGALVSCVCFASGLISTPSEMSRWLVLPLYVADWYFIGAAIGISRAKLKFRDCLTALGVTTPFWIGSFFWSRSCYDSLPATPGCFIVTAASRGHRCLVGPFFPESRSGNLRQANQQLLRFWRFEAVWQSGFPRMHAAFRWIYNRVGPILARRIRSPWFADFIYLALKPLELVAMVLVKFAAFCGGRQTSTKEKDMNYAKQIQHFVNNRRNRREPDWTAPISVPAHVLAPVLRSIEQFRLGDGGGPASLIAHDAENFRGRTDEMRQIVDLWFAEEAGHARLLGCAVKRFGGRVIESHWSFTAFCLCRRALGVRFELQVLTLTELVSTAYYRMLRKYSPDGPLAAMCELILRDEAGHVAFQRDRIAASGTPAPGVRGWLWRIQFLLSGYAAGTMLWVNHAPCLKAIGGTRAEFYREITRLITRFIRSLQPAAEPPRVAARWAQPIVQPQPVQ